MELIIASHEKASPVFDPRKKATIFKDSLEYQLIKESMGVTMTFTKASIGQKLKDKAAN